MVFQIFNNKISTAAVVIMLLFYMTLVSRAIIISLWPQPEISPLQIKHVELINTVLKPGEPLVERVDATINIHGCDSYILRTVIDQDTKQEVWISIHGRPRGEIDDVVEKQKIIIVQIPELKQGNYNYRAEIHEICNGKSYITLIPLLAFTVVEEKKNDKIN